MTWIWSCRLTGTDFPAAQEISQGTPSPTRMLRICDPVELDTAIEPCPRRATVTDWMVSGISAPTATTHIPKKHVGTSNSSPKRPTTAAMTVENKDTHKKEATKVTDTAVHRVNP